MEVAAALPQAIGNYRIEREVGRGGMGAVYIGVHQLIGKRAAIKVLLPQVSQRQDLVQRFFNEAKAASAIHHPGIVDVHDYGVGDDGNAFIVMEYLEGESLAARLKSHGRFAIPVAVSIARQIALALAAAHRAGIVHRDLKPDNVFLVRDPDGGERIKLLDFGVAKLVDEAGTAGPATVTGAILGTPQYMSPEQCEGSRVVDHRSDLYSLGCTMFIMLAGRLPFLETGIGGLIGAHLHTPAPPLRDHCAAASPALGAIVDRLLAKSPDDRFATAEALAAALHEPAISVALQPAPIPVTPVAAGGPTVSTQAVSEAPATQVDPPRASRSRWPLLLGGLAIAAVAGGVAFALLRKDSPTEVEAQRTVERETKPPVDPPIVDVAKADPPKDLPRVVIKPAAPPSEAALRLELARDAGKRGDFALAAGELDRLDKAKPDAAIRAEADQLKADLAPQAIAVAAKRIAKLRDSGKCNAAKEDARKTAATWGKSLSLDSAATPCKSDIPSFDDAGRARSSDTTPDDDDAPAAIHAAYAAKRYKVAFDRCVQHPPDRPALFVPCMVSACQIKQPRMAVAWMRRRKPNKRETDQIVNALNGCQAAGIRLPEVVKEMNAQTKVGDKPLPLPLPLEPEFGPEQPLTERR